MSIKYSFLMPYHRRSEQLMSTLESFQHHYINREDFEIIVIEDLKNNSDINEHTALLDVVNHFPLFNIRIFHLGAINRWNPVDHFNSGAAVARGEYLIITNPECLHKADVLAGLDDEFEREPRAYVICGCLSAPNHIRMTPLQAFSYQGDSWYQHSVHRNAMVHFCSAISVRNFQKIGGFDPEYAKGVCYEDDDFRNKIIESRIPIVLRDDLLTIHLAHNKSKPPDYMRLYKHNQEYYDNKWGSAALRAEKMSVEAHQKQ